jgi:hypothetical protein
MGIDRHWLSKHQSPPSRATFDYRKLAREEVRLIAENALMHPSFGSVAPGSIFVCDVSIAGDLEAAGQARKFEPTDE